MNLENFHAVAIRLCQLTQGRHQHNSCAMLQSRVDCRIIIALRLPLIIFSHIKISCLSHFRMCEKFVRERLIVHHYRHNSPSAIPWKPNFPPVIFFHANKEMLRQNHQKDRSPSFSGVPNGMRKRSSHDNRSHRSCRCWPLEVARRYRTRISIFTLLFLLLPHDGSRPLWKSPLTP